MSILRMLRRRQSLLTPNILKAKLLHVRTVHWNSWGDEGHLSLKDEGVAAGSHYGSGADQISANLRRTLAPSVGPEILISTNVLSNAMVVRRAGSENSQMGPSTEEVGGYSSDGSSRSRSRGRPRSAQKRQKSVSRGKGTSKSHRSVRSEARSRSKSKSVKSKPQLVRASRRKSSSDSGYDTVSDSGSEDLSMLYRASGGGSHAGMVQDVPPADLEAFWARNWFDSLDPKSVDGFEELSNKFLEEFSQQKRKFTHQRSASGVKDICIYALARSSRASQKAQ
ncbi:hypothetical protein Tco_1360868 [Tanacetum coccineum]